MADGAGKRKGQLQTLLQTYWSAAKECSDWMTIIGLVLNVLSVSALAVALFKLPLASIVKTLLDFYVGTRNTIFYPFEQIFDIHVPPGWKDFLVAWTTIGVVGARTTLWLNRKHYAAYHEARLKAEDPQARQSAITRLGKAKVEEELAWINEREEFHKLTPFKTRTIYIGCILTGPLFFFQIWRVVPPIPGEPINGRQMLIVQLLTLAAGFLAIFALNWALPSSG